jgi:cytochrome b pre-mRNA-processing protein 3
MILDLLRRRPPADTIRALYGVIVAQARLPVFYLDYGVPDTVEGRFDMIVLHLAVLTRRIGGSPRLKAISQGVFDLFCQDLDHNLREMGVSDLAVPRRMRGFAEAFYGRSQSYDQALSSRDREAGALAVARNVFAAGKPSAGAQRLTAYMFEAARQLADIDERAVARGVLSFPDPDTIPVVADNASDG